MSLIARVHIKSPKRWPVLSAMVGTLLLVLVATRSSSAAGPPPTPAPTPSATPSQPPSSPFVQNAPTSDASSVFGLLPDPRQWAVDVFDQVLSNLIGTLSQGLHDLIASASLAVPSTSSPRPPPTVPTTVRPCKPSGTPSASCPTRRWCSWRSGAASTSWRASTCMRPTMRRWSSFPDLRWVRCWSTRVSVGDRSRSTPITPCVSWSVSLACRPGSGPIARHKPNLRVFPDV